MNSRCHSFNCRDDPLRGHAVVELLSGDVCLMNQESIYPIPLPHKMTGLVIPEDFYNTLSKPLTVWSRPTDARVCVLGQSHCAFGFAFDACFTVCACVIPGSGCRALSWCRSAWTRSWTRRRCWRAGNPTSANQCRWPTTVLCSTAARCREIPAARPATVTERRHTPYVSVLAGAVDYIFLCGEHKPSITEHKQLFQ